MALLPNQSVLSALEACDHEFEIEFELVEMHFIPAAVLHSKRAVLKRFSCDVFSFECLRVFGGIEAIQHLSPQCIFLERKMCSVSYIVGCHESLLRRQFCFPQVIHAGV